jgi:hypothetical protein
MPLAVRRLTALTAHATASLAWPSPTARARHRLGLGSRRPLHRTYLPYLLLLLFVRLTRTSLFPGARARVMGGEGRP